jgi:tripartite-type tricarboxylate transporter receptor subunit TctC
MNKLLGVAVLTASLLAAQSATAQYPSKPVHLIVGFPAGGVADNLARVFAQALSPGLGQPVIVENKPGADSAIGADYVAKSAPDGYTIFYGTVGAFAVAPALRKDLPYDPVMHFTPLSHVADGTFILFTHASVPATTLDELIAYARANPDKLNYATGNLTAVVATAQLMRAAGIRMVHVPYKGEATSFPDLVAGRVQLSFFSTVSLALPLVKEGRLRALAAMTDHRSPLAPDVPTLAETGFPSVSARVWYGLAGPAKLPRDIIERLSREANVALKRPDVREQFLRQGYDARASTPEEFGTYVKSQLALWKQAVKESGLAVE